MLKYMCSILGGGHFERRTDQVFATRAVTELSSTPALAIEVVV